MAKKPLDLGTATREELIEKVENLRIEVANLADVNRRSLAHQSSLSERLRRIKKFVRDEE